MVIIIKQKIETRKTNIDLSTGRWMSIKNYLSTHTHAKAMCYVLEVEEWERNIERKSFENVSQLLIFCITCGYNEQKNIFLWTLSTA